MSNIRLYLVDGHYWLGVEHAGRLMLICRKGKAGDLVRP